MAVIKINPMKLTGPWIDGRVLDFHTISSTWTGDPYHYNTKRTELGERVYGLKYGGARDVITDIVETAEMFVKQWKPEIDCIVPAPPSQSRKSQPVVEIAKELSKRLGIPVCEDALVKAEATPQMKNIKEWSERENLLRKAIQVGAANLTGKSILLVDDLIQSGSTLRCAAEVLVNQGGARAVYALVLTRTRG
ncbi:MAG: ComF family protein [Candidatus Acidiferrales bacterium]